MTRDEVLARLREMRPRAVIMLWSHDVAAQASGRCLICGEVTEEVTVPVHHACLAHYVTRGAASDTEDDGSESEPWDATEVAWGLMHVIQACDEDEDEDGLCECARAIRSELLRARMVKP